MTKYREILRLANLGLIQQNIADSCGVSKKTVNRVLRKTKELNISWSLGLNDTDEVLAEKLFTTTNKPVASNKRMLDFACIRKELLHRRRKKSSTIFCSRYEFEEWYDQFGGDVSPLEDAIINRIAHDSYRINITSIDAEHDISMREVHGLDKNSHE